MSKNAIDWTAVPKQFVIWSVICSISAGPSFFWAYHIHPHWWQHAAVITGVVIYVVAYTVVGSSYRMQFARRNKALRVTLRIGYGTRILLSVIYPVGLIVDAWLGMVSLSLVSGITTGDFDFDHYNDSVDKFGFVRVLVATLIHGFLVNMALMVFVGFIYIFARLFLPTRPAQTGLCLQCGYDLRASANVCPECGTPTQPNLVRA